MMKLMKAVRVAWFALTALLLTAQITAIAQREGGTPASGTGGPASGPSLGLPTYISGNYYINPYASAPTAGTAGVANTYYCSPYWISQTVTIKALAIRVNVTSAGNSSGALQGAIYADLVTTAPAHRPGALIDFTANFATGAAATVSAAMNNTTDTITGPAMVWTCLQHFDTTAAAVSWTTSGSVFPVTAIGTATLANSISQSGTANAVVGVSTPGTGYGGVNWVNFTSSTAWTEAATTTAPIMAIQAN